MAGYLTQVQYPSYAGNDVINFPSYDNSGRLLKRIDNRTITNGMTTTNVEADYQYNDPDGNLSDVTYPNTTGLNSHFVYDSYDRPTTLTDSVGSRAYTYDDGDRLLTAQTTYNGLSAQTLTYGYYPDGSRKTLAMPTGTSTYHYDFMGRLTGLTNPFGENYSWLYDFASRLSGYQSANAVQTYFSYNAANQLVSRTNATLSGTIFSNFSLPASPTPGYDPNGNLTSLVVSQFAGANFTGTNSYTYDSLNRLTQENSTRNGGYSYTSGFDNDGNLTSLRNGPTQSFNTSDQFTGAGFAYDLVGNPTTYNTNTLTFDIESRLTSVSNTSGTALTAGYRTDGLRAWKQGSSGTRTYYLYDGMEPLCELNSSGGVTYTNTFGPGGLLSRHQSGGATTFYAFDWFGTVAHRLDASGNVLGSQMFDAYGKRWSTDNSTDPFTGFGGQWGYYTDSETGYTLCGHRYYDASTGRFLTRDPIGKSGGVNLYAYVGNNPTGHADPSGFWADPFDDNTPDSAFTSDLNAGDHPGICGVQGLGNAAFHLIPGAGFYGAITGNDIWGNPLSMQQRTDEAEQAALSFFPLEGEVEESVAATAANDGCFVAGTPVAVQARDVTVTGTTQTSRYTVATKSIETLQAGDLVPSRDEKSGKTEWKRIERTTVRKVLSVLTVSLSDATTGQIVEQITATHDHPFYVRNKGFVPAGSLAIGNVIVTRAGPTLAVKKIEWHYRAEGYDVYNCVIEGNHTYFVGNIYGGVWVHNPRWCPAQLTMESDLGLSPIQEPYEWHHPYPKYLGGAADQPMVNIPRSMHKLIHSELDKTFDRRAGSAAFANVPISDVWNALSDIYNKNPLDIDPNTGSPFRWK